MESGPTRGQIAEQWSGPRQVDLIGDEDQVAGSLALRTDAPRRVGQQNAGRPERRGESNGEYGQRRRMPLVAVHPAAKIEHRVSGQDLDDLHAHRMTFDTLHGLPEDLGQRNRRVERRAQVDRQPRSRDQGEARLRPSETAVVSDRCIDQGLCVENT